MSTDEPADRPLERTLDRLDAGVSAYRAERRRRANGTATRQPPSDDPDASVSTTTIAPNSAYETTLYEIDSGVPGPVGFVLGGQHGDEPAGWEAAHAIREMEPRRGTLVVVPEANRPAIEASEREVDGVDVNREWGTGSEPTIEITAAIWRQFERYDPDVSIDLHSSVGVLDGPCDGIGQAIFPAPNAAFAASTVVEELNEAYVAGGDLDEDLRFRAGSVQDGTKDYFSYKVGYETDALGFLFESARCETDLRQRIEWTVAGAVACLREGGVVLT